MAKVITFEKRLGYSDAVDNYTVKLKRRRKFPWWVLLLLIPIGLLYVIIANNMLMGNPGKLRFNLQWETHSDLDLWVYDPCGNHIGFSNKKATCNENLGQLDYDIIQWMVIKPQENIYWENPPKGVYRVVVHCFAWHESLDTRHIDFKLRVVDSTGNPKVYTNVIKHNHDSVFVTDYVVK